MSDDFLERDYKKLNYYGFESTMNKENYINSNLYWNHSKILPTV